MKELSRPRTASRDHRSNSWLGGQLTDSTEYLHTKCTCSTFPVAFTQKHCAYPTWPLSSAESPPPTCSDSLWPGPEASSHCSPHALSLLLSPPNTGPTWVHQQLKNSQTLCWQSCAGLTQNSMCWIMAKGCSQLRLNEWWCWCMCVGVLKLISLTISASP